MRTVCPHVNNCEPFHTCLFTDRNKYMCPYIPQKKRNYTEHKEQAALIQWRDLNKNNLPGLELLHSIPNGGHRPRREAARMKAEGALSGIPDLFLPVPRKGWRGFYIEMKAGTNKLSADQKEMHAKLTLQGYYVETHWNWIDAKNAIEEYLKN
jgi:hypothetical protein